MSVFCHLSPSLPWSLPRPCPTNLHTSPTQLQASYKLTTQKHGSPGTDPQISLAPRTRPLIQSHPHISLDSFHFYFITVVPTWQRLLCLNQSCALLLPASFFLLPTTSCRCTHSCSPAQAPGQHPLLSLLNDPYWPIDKLCLPPILEGKLSFHQTLPP